MTDDPALATGALLEARERHDIWPCTLPHVTCQRERDTAERVAMRVQTGLSHTLRPLHPLHLRALVVRLLQALFEDPTAADLRRFVMREAHA